MVSQEELALVRRLSRGDKSALKELYERHIDQLTAFLRALGASRDEAEDIAHDAFVKAWHAAEQFAGRSSVKSWLYTIAKNKLIDRRRRAKPLSGEDAAFDLPDEGATPFDAAVHAEDRRRVAHCVETLSDSHRLAIRLIYFDDLSIAEAAEIMECPVGTVKTRLHHAKQLLMRCLTSKA
ncbi:MAG: RNA polymerase sigma factor [Pseudomonadota bacterium]